MKSEILKNKFKVIYKHNESNLTSICISIDAGAGVEKEKLGVAHTVEHMVYKGTKNRSEDMINSELTEIFGFQNAMTNYPYVIYYGTLLSEDFEKAIDLFSDIILNPSFETNGFKEEMDVIKEELEEWDEDLEQYCEDKLFLNSFNNRRIKYPIIGTKESLDKISLEDIRGFYNEHYNPENASIVINTNLDFEFVYKIINRYFGEWESSLENKTENKSLYEIPKNAVFYDKREGIKTSRVQIIAPIHDLNIRELKALSIFNAFFGEGVNSLLYDNLRTKNGLIYDVITTISNEKYIKLYKITYNTGKEKIEDSLNVFYDCINKISELEEKIKVHDINKTLKNMKLKKLFKEEKSIILAKELSTYDTMFKDYNIYNDQIEDLSSISKEEIFSIGKRILNNISIQVIS